MNISFWEQPVWYQPFDIIIVGAGILGLSCAIHAKQQHPTWRILVVEAHAIPTGASTRNAGFACFGSPTELLHDIEQTSESETLAIVEMRYKGIAQLRQWLGDEKLCFNPCGGFECLTANDTSALDALPYLNGLLTNITATENTFQVVTETLSQQGLRNFSALIKSSAEGSIHSGYAMYHLANYAVAQGVTIRYGCNVISWNRVGTYVNVQTNRGILTTERLLLCTNAFSMQLAPQILWLPGRGQVIVTAPIKGLTLKGTFHSEAGYYYFRNVENRILIGGGRHTCFEAETTTDLNTTDLTEHLISYLQNHTSYEIPCIEYAWAGIMCFTNNKQPTLQPLSEGVWAATACNGMGVATSPSFAEKIIATV
ncbi:MAG: NAD(P)/FAD-dependent oxidoreductase [Chitinophagaceae bacterium]